MGLSHVDLISWKSGEGRKDRCRVYGFCEAKKRWSLGTRLFLVLLSI